MGKYSSLEGVGPLPEDIRRGRVGPFAAEAKAPFPVERLNSSGVALLNGDVVVVGTDGTILRTTTAQDTRPVGVLLDDCADGIYGPVLFEGPCPLVNVTGSVTAGHYVETTATGGQATGNSTRREGSFGRFTSGGTTPTAFLYGPQPDLTGSASSGGGGGTTAVVAGKVTKTDGDFATSSTSFVDVTGAAVTITTAARRCLVIVTGDFYATSDSIYIGVAIDGTLQGGTLGSFATFTTNERVNISFTIMTGVLSAASHTFQLRARSAAGGTITIDADTGFPLELAVVELATV